MSGYELIAALVDSVAWPIAVLVLAILLRHPIAQLLRTMTKLRYKELEIDFSEEVEAIREAAQEDPVPIELTERHYSPEIERLRASALEVANTSPQAAVVLAWTHLSSEMNAIAHSSGMQSKSRAPVSSIKVISTLVEEGKMTEGQAKLVNAMRELRNKAVHQHPDVADISRQVAEEFIENAAWQLHRLSGGGT